jgi:molybdopterin-guanine dinucleotide biosynthesis protein A
MLSANRNLDEYRKLGFPVVPDIAGELGPLGGIEAAMEIVETELLFVCPGDSPLVPGNLVALLVDPLKSGVEAVIPHDGKRRQPLFMLVRRTCRKSLQRYLSGGGRSVHGWLENLQTVELTIMDGEGFSNINTSDDLLEMERNL